ncbi:hypothetical protein AgCh_024511 [Apium graveolens]
MRWCHDIGLEQAPNKPLLKTIFQGEVPLLSYSVHKPQAHKMVEMMKSRVYRKHATSGLGAAAAAADLLRNGFYVVLASGSHHGAHFIALRYQLGSFLLNQDFLEYYENAHIFGTLNPEVEEQQRDDVLLLIGDQIMDPIERPNAGSDDVHIEDVAVEDVIIEGTVAEEDPMEDPDKNE